MIKWKSLRNTLPIKAFEWSSSSLEGIGCCWLFSSSSHTHTHTKKENRRFYIILKTNVNFSMNFLKTTEKKDRKVHRMKKTLNVFFILGRLVGMLVGRNNNEKWFKALILQHEKLFKYCFGIENRIKSRKICWCKEKGEMF